MVVMAGANRLFAASTAKIGFAGNAPFVSKPSTMVVGQMPVLGRKP
jgi:hypothetical protein